MGAGRFFCVAIPFILTLGSLLCILIVMTAGMTNKNLDMFSITPKDLSISLDSLKGLSDDNSGLDVGSYGDVNVTADTLGLQNGYQVYMWNYCYQNATNNNTWCSKAEFNWASKALDIDALQRNISEAAMAVAGQNVTIPHDISDALKVYVTISRWIQIVYTIAAVLTGLELFLGLFGFCSRIASCLTYFVSALSSLALIVASSGVTAASVILVGAMDTTLKKYGVDESVGRTYLVVTWLAVALSIASGLFWAFSSCCCASNRPYRQGDGEKPYTPIHITNNNSVGNGAAGAAPYPPASGNGRVGGGGGGYEPYRNV